MTRPARLLTTLAVTACVLAVIIGALLPVELPWSGVRL